MSEQRVQNIMLLLELHLQYHGLIIGPKWIESQQNKKVKLYLVSHHDFQIGMCQNPNTVFGKEMTCTTEHLKGINTRFRRTHRSFSVPYRIQMHYLVTSLLPKSNLPSSLSC